MVERRTESKTFVTTTEAATEQLGISVGLHVSEGMCVSLVGSLGSGKSVLVRGICRGLAVGEDVLSPTFILFEEYRGRLPVVHLDLYRLEHESEIEELGVFERLGNDTVILVEWGDRSSRILEVSDVLIHLEMAGDTERKIVMQYPAALARVFEKL